MAVKGRCQVTSSRRYGLTADETVLFFLLSHQAPSSFLTSLTNKMTDHTKCQNDIKPTTAEELPHSEYYYDPNGNLEIVSSDGILLRLEAYRLQASS